MADQDLQITLSLNDQASDAATTAFTKISSSANASASQASAAYNQLGNAATDSGNKQEASFIKTKGSFDHLLLTVGSLIIAYKLLQTGFDDVSKVGAEMDTGINASFENFNAAVLAVEASIALKLKPQIETVTNFWTEQLNKVATAMNGGGDGSLSQELDTEKLKLQQLHDTLLELENATDKNTAANVTETESVVLQIRMQTLKIETINKLMGTQKDANTVEVSNFVQLQKSTEALKDFATQQKNNQTLFDAGKTSAANYYKQLTTGEVQANQDIVTRGKTLQSVATLENEANDSTLLEFLKVENEKKAALQTTVNAMTMSFKDQVQGVTTAFDAFSSALSSMASQNKAFGAVAKASAIASAIINTAVAITKAHAMYPFPINVAIEAIEATTGAIQIATIASQQLSTGTDTVPAMLTPGEMVVPQSMAAAIRAGSLTLGGPDAQNGGSSTSTQKQGDTYISIQVDRPTVSKPSDIQALTEEISKRLYNEFNRIH